MWKIQLKEEKTCRPAPHLVTIPVQSMDTVYSRLTATKETCAKTEQGVYRQKTTPKTQMAKIFKAVGEERFFLPKLD